MADAISTNSFDLYFPLPYRVAFILIIGIWLWGLNLHCLHTLRINVAVLVRYGSSGDQDNTTHSRVYRIAGLLTLGFGLSIISFWLLTHGDSVLVRGWEIIPQSFLILTFVLFAVPVQRLSKGGRYHFLKTLRRIVFGRIAFSHEGRFGDVLLADALTSYSKVIADLFLSFYLFFSPSRYSTVKPDRRIGGSFWVPLIISIPSLIRLRQCLIEFARARQSNFDRSNLLKGGQHLANALKYSTALPVTIISSLLRSSHAKGLVGEATLTRLWFVSALTNSVYSFYWDVMKDWDLTLFSTARSNGAYAWGLRRRTYFAHTSIYYAAILLDLILRCTWSLKLSPHLDHFNDIESGIFLLELLEVFRRWIWIFFRIETEWVRYSEADQNLATNEVQLTRFDEMGNFKAFQ